MRYSKAFLFIVLAAAVLCATAPALAQGLTSASLSGHVTQSGAGVPGVTVTAKSPALQGSRTTQTGANGDYVFVSLPPGEYTVTFALAGFQPQTKPPIRLNAGASSDLDAALSINVEAATTVEGRAEIVSTTPQASTTHTAAEMEKLPTTRTLLASVNLSAGVNQNGPNNAFTVGGAMSYENLFTVDGVVVSDNVRTTPNNLFIEDAIAETSTIVSGISAEFGRFQGGVVNAITKSGGNTFSGSFRTSFTNDAWQAKSPTLITNNSNYVPNAPKEQALVQDVIPRYEATLGGPIWKDRIWFFGATRIQNPQTSANLAQPVNTTFTQGDDQKRYEGKLTISPFMNHTVTGTYLRVDETQTNYAFPSIPVMDFASVYNRELPQEQIAVAYNGTLSSNLFIEGQYSKRKFSFQNSGGIYTDLIQGTVVRDVARGQAYNSPIFCGICGPELRNNDDWYGKGTYFLATPSLGSHTIAVGYDNFGGQRLSNNYQSGSNYHVFGTTSIVRDGVIYPQWIANGPSTRLVWYPIPVLSQGSNVRTQSAFLNDSWRLSTNLSFNVGVRYDKNDAKDSFGSTTAKDSAWSPRLAIMWDPRGDNKIQFRGSYAKYVAAPAETQVGAGSPAGSPAVDVYNYLGPSINADANAPTLLTTAQALQQLFNWYGISAPNQQPNVLPNSASVPGVNVLITQGGLDSPSVNEYVLGFGGQIGSKGSFRIDAVKRKYVDFYNERIDTSTGQVTNSLGQHFDVHIVENTNAAERQYYGLNTSFEYRVATPFRLGGNWTWSHTYGNFNGENSGSGPLRYAGQQYPEYTQGSWNVPRGDLATDQRHRVRVYGTYDLPVPASFGAMSVGLLEAMDTGTPYGAVGTVNPSSYVTNPGYLQVPTAVNYYFTARDAFRTETTYQTDLSLNMSKTIGPIEIFIQPQVLNVFNAAHVILVDATVLTNASAGGGSNAFTAFNPFTTTPVQRPNGNTTVKNANWDYGPNFGQPTSQTSSGQAGSYQLPRTFRISAGIRF
jgi:outer membrane receptor protein involved in Fe transport